MTKARRDALRLPEILEQIISHLPGYTILTRAQRVSKLWKDVIDTSPVVQKKLWMGPRGARVSPPTGISTEQDTHIHQPMSEFAVKALSSGVPIYPGSFHVNTLFPRLYSKQALRDNRRLAAHYVTIVVLPRGKLNDIGIRRPMTSANKSRRPTWLNMHLTKPPITTAWIQFHVEGSSLPPIQKSIPATVRNVGGLTFGSVIDAVNRMIAQRTYISLAHSISVRIR
jgi:hypothetical protein